VLLFVGDWANITTYFKRGAFYNAIKQLLPVSPAIHSLSALWSARLSIDSSHAAFWQATNSVHMKSCPLERAGWDRCIVPEMPFKSGRCDQSFWRAVSERFESESQAIAALNHPTSGLRRRPDSGHGVNRRRPIVDCEQPQASAGWGAATRATNCCRRSSRTR